LQNTLLHPIAETGRQRFGGADVYDKGQSKDKKKEIRHVEHSQRGSGHDRF
jgi:hypothetical protein